MNNYQRRILDSFIKETGMVYIYNPADNKHILVNYDNINRPVYEVVVTKGIIKVINHENKLEKNMLVVLHLLKAINNLGFNFNDVSETFMKNMVLTMDRSETPIIFAEELNYDDYINDEKLLDAYE